MSFSIGKYRMRNDGVAVVHAVKRDQHWALIGMYEWVDLLNGSRIWKEASWRKDGRHINTEHDSGYDLTERIDETTIKRQEG